MFEIGTKCIWNGIKGTVIQNLTIVTSDVCIAWSTHTWNSYDLEYLKESIDNGTLKIIIDD
jgi:hypothetical protein